MATGTSRSGSAFGLALTGGVGALLVGGVALIVWRRRTTKVADVEP